MFELGTSRRYLQPMTFVRSLLFENSICGFAFISFFYLCQGGYVFIGVCLFVSRITQKLLHLVEKLAHVTRKKTLDFGVGADQVTLV